MTAAIGLSAASFVVVMGTIIAYFRTIPRHKVPGPITGVVVKLVVGVALGGAAVVWSVRTIGTAGAAVIAPAAFATVMASMVLWLLSQRKTPVGDLRVKEGDALLAFEATTSEGAPFHSDELAGKRTLLKFFRGGW